MSFAQVASGPLQTYYSNDFSSGLNGAILSGSAALTAGSVHLTPNVTNQLGGITIPASGINADKYHVEFTLSTSQLAGVGADGLSYSFGDDVSATSTTLSAEYGSGTKLSIGFDTYTAALPATAMGIRLIYGPTSPNPGVIVGIYNVLGYSTNVSWAGAGPVPVVIDITNTGLLTLSVNGVVIFSDVQLPTDYLTADRSNWAHVFKARTGGVSQVHAVDDVIIQQPLIISQRFEHVVQGSLQQIFTVPVAGWYFVKASGGQGGKCSNGTTNGAPGARMNGFFNFQAGEQLIITVGGMGLQGANNNNDVSGGGGGGASAVVRFGGLNNYEPLVVAGGGGGAGVDEGFGTVFASAAANGQITNAGGVSGSGSGGPAGSNGGGGGIGGAVRGGAGGAGFYGDGGTHCDGACNGNNYLAFGGQAYVAGNYGGSAPGSIGGNGGYGGGGEGGPAGNTSKGGGGGGGGYSGGAGAAPGQLAAAVDPMWRPSPTVLDWSIPPGPISTMAGC